MNMHNEYITASIRRHEATDQLTVQGNVLLGGRPSQSNDSDVHTK